MHEDRGFEPHLGQSPQDHDEEESPYDTHQETDVPQVVVTSRSPGSDEGKIFFKL